MVLGGRVCVNKLMGSIDRAWDPVRVSDPVVPAPLPLPRPLTDARLGRRHALDEVLVGGEAAPEHPASGERHPCLWLVWFGAHSGGKNQHAVKRKSFE